MNLEKLIKETLASSVPETLEAPPSAPESPLAEADDVATEAAIEPQDMSEPQRDELSTAEPDAHQEPLLSIPELFDTDTQPLDAQVPDARTFNLPEEPEVEGEPAAPVLGNMDETSPEHVDVDVPENTPPQQQEFPEHEVDVPPQVADEHAEVAAPDVVSEERLGVSGFASTEQGDSPDPADQMYKAAVQEEDFAQQLAKALNPEFTATRDHMAWVAQDYVHMGLTLLRILSDVS